MVTHCLDFYQQVDLTGYWIALKSLTWISIPKIVQRVKFSKLILSILKNYVNCTMIIL